MEITQDEIDFVAFLKLLNQLSMPAAVDYNDLNSAVCHCAG
jgi:hypothetical protein